jgi:hypothetical protein
VLDCIRENNICNPAMQTGLTKEPRILEGTAMLSDDEASKEKVHIRRKLIKRLNF